jgi:pentapeptide MXKDX repeat protein
MRTQSRIALLVAGVAALTAVALSAGTDSMGYDSLCQDSMGYDCVHTASMGYDVIRNDSMGYD